MQRQALIQASRLCASSTRHASICHGATASLVLPASKVGVSTAGPSRTFTTSRVVGKKSKVAPLKPVKGKIRAEDDPSDTDANVSAAVDKTREKMEKAVNWAKGVVYDGVERGRGRVSPAILDTVRVEIPDHDSAQTLNSIASVTVKQNTLYVEIWDTSTMKHVEAALHKASLPGISPQRVDERTLKMPVSRPTVEQRTQILKNLNTTIEGAKQQVRTARADGFKLVGGKTAQGSSDVQDLANEYGKQLDDLLVQAKKEFDK